MNLSFFIAKRYLLSKRKKNFINIISWLSMCAVTVITASLVVVLSVFNGFGDLLRSLNNSFDPEIKIEVVEGKSFAVSDSLLTELRSIEGVAIVTEVIEDYAYLRYREANQVITLKGVSDNFIDQHRIDSAIVAGELRLTEGAANYAIIGQGIEYNLSIVVDDPLYPLQIYYIKNLSAASLDPSKLYAKSNIVPSSVFSIVQNFDANYVIVPLRFAMQLMDYGNKRTSLEIKTHATASPEKVVKLLQEKLGKEFLVLSHDEQHKDLYRLLKMERLFVFIAFVVLLGVGSINIFFSLSMLALEKKKDISVLMAMGANHRLIRLIFITEGALIAFVGTALGLLIGGVICWLQQSFGLVSMGINSGVVDGYPVKPIFSDFVLIFIVVALLTFIISFRPAQLAARSAAADQL